MYYVVKRLLLYIPYVGYEENLNNSLCIMYENDITVYILF